MKLWNVTILPIFALIALSLGCSSTTLEPPNTEESKAIVYDRNSRGWDVTYARDVYNMDPKYYNYGLGINAIPSVDDPVVLQEGDVGYPASDSNIRVFGVDHNGEQRAYSISDLSAHEVFNDTYPGESDQYLAITF